MGVGVGEIVGKLALDRGRRCLRQDGVPQVALFGSERVVVEEAKVANWDGLEVGPSLPAVAWKPVSALE